MTNQKKQVIFRVDEELHRRLQMYVLQKNSTIQDVMEGLLEQLLRGGHVLKARLLRVIQDKLLNHADEVRHILKSAFIHSLRLDSSDDDTVIQVIINEHGEIRERETQKGFIPNSVIDLKSYVLCEFPCVHVMEIYYQHAMLDMPDMYQPITGYHEGFAAWLKTHGMYEDQDEDDAEIIVTHVLNHVSFTQGRAYDPFLELVYRYSPDAYRDIMNHIRNSIMDSFVIDEQVEASWKEIVGREELGL